MSPAKSRSELSRPLALVLLALLSLSVFWPLHQAEFLNLDDQEYVTENPYIQEGLTFEGLKWAFGARLLYASRHADDWQPVTVLSRMADISLWGVSAQGHHAMNILYHLLNVGLVFLILHKMTGQFWKSFLAALLFGVHPIQVEAVAWITSRKDLLSAFWGLFTLYLYALFPKPFLRKQQLALVAAFSLSLMAKPAWIPLPLILIALDFWPLKNWDSAKLGQNLKRSLGNTWPLIILSLGFAGLTYHLQNDILYDVSILDRLTRSLLSYGFYIKQVFYPQLLAIYGPLAEPSIPSAGLIISSAFLLGSTFVFILMRRNHPYLIVGWLWYLVALVPAVHLNTPADRYMYFPLIGLAIVAAWGVSDLIRGLPYLRQTAPLLGVMIIGVLMALSHHQTQFWMNDVRVFGQALRYDAKNYMAHNGLAYALANQGSNTKALEHYQESLRLNPNYPDAHCNVGVLYEALGQNDKAREHYSKAVELKPNYPEALSNLGNRLRIQGQDEQALAHIRQAIALKPHLPDAHNNLGVLYENQGKLREAQSAYREAIRLKPDYPEPYNNLGNILAKTGHYEEAIRHYREALRLRPDYANAKKNLNIVIKLKNARKN